MTAQATPAALPAHLCESLCRVYDALQELDALTVCVDTDPTQQREPLVPVNLWAQQACDSLKQLAHTQPAVAHGMQACGIKPAQENATPAYADARRRESNTQLFVSNLPPHVDDAALHALFAAFSPVSAHVVRKSNGTSKGFGFVHVADAAQHERARAAPCTNMSWTVAR